MGMPEDPDAKTLTEQYLSDRADASCKAELRALHEASELRAENRRLLSRIAELESMLLQKTQKPTDTK